MSVLLRSGLALLAIIQVTVGGWNLLWPESFYRNFPTVDLTPPFAEHYARDFGGALLGLGLVLACAAVVPRNVLVVPALIGIGAFGIPHFVFHLLHLHHATPGEAMFAIASTAVSAVLPPALLVVVAIRARRDRRSARQSATPARAV